MTSHRSREPLEALDQPALAALGREYLLAGHLIDRAGMPQLISELGLEGMRDIAIEEWMAASPVYTKRMQQLLGFSGTDVATIFKGIQIDIGAPPQFMDFRFKVDGPDTGEFWLAHCGALMDVEPMGEEFVLTMCHHIEDPTFDATACATNPRAQVRPIHRPPRHPSDRHPHCHWTVQIDDANEPVLESVFTREMWSTRAAMLPISPRTDYAGDFDPDFSLQDLSRDALLAVLPEICLQGQLLARAFMLATERRAGMEVALRIGTSQLVGIGGLTAKRLARHLDSGGGLAGIGRVLSLHPAFLPGDYVDVVITVDPGAATLRITLRPCASLDEGDELTWPALLMSGVHGADRAIAAMVQAVEPRASVERVPADDAASLGAAAAWEITVDPDAVPADDPSEVVLTSFSTGADFEFRPR